MPAKKAGLNIRWPFAPAQVGLNTDTNLLKIVAMITMMIDHCGKVLFPQYNIMRIIGRLAFPIYAYCIAVGCVYTRDRARYLSRIVLLALIVQPVYAIAFKMLNPQVYAGAFAEYPCRTAVRFYMDSWKHPSILLSLSIAILVIWTIRERKLTLTLALALFIWIVQDSLDYGWKGIVLMTLFYLFCGKWWISLPIVFSFMLWWGLQGGKYELFDIEFGTQLFALCALPLIYIPTYSKLKLNKWIFYLFYPAHLIFIIAADKLMG